MAATDATPVIMVTGHGDERVASDALKIGAFGYVVKDSRMLELLADAIRFIHSNESVSALFEIKDND